MLRWMKKRIGEDGASQSIILVLPHTHRKLICNTYLKIEIITLSYYDFGSLKHQNSTQRDVLESQVQLD